MIVHLESMAGKKRQGGYWRKAPRGRGRDGEKKKKKMRSSRFLNTKPQDDELKAPSPPENGTPPRRGIVESILSLFGLITFHLFRYFQDRGLIYKVHKWVYRIEYFSKIMKVNINTWKEIV